MMPLVIMTGASGSGKTAIAKAIEVGHPSISVFRFDTIGVPSGVSLTELMRLRPEIAADIQQLRQHRPAA